ncbi:2Fe-2S iron-sulfur cluster-binding protein [Aestuariirhabdus sp. Z084]|uniref:2Fe-2S iron-sulfur cluster-binding protein n=1 Tax=Aestuariirhabdus haliotis TaxID=2918751 RepID=UPI00201B3CBD|nr:2Fe-2S iron-sulfur cluster-binding protein [Aestuariirhabdus haliotis]MCL6417621.1 2Fe-2S iron-sulfur cluster-binding protein [Aestuariirhabdus haliotis]MCL6421547.1 2Fe-2S iron-sulfur cluster-binding protein [Aestuariirhabdus haliotis]
MPRAFANIAFTPSVKAAQTRNGSREANAGFEVGDPEKAELGFIEQEFIAERDSFYQATVSENGWPYVQHRGGPRGFLKVLDKCTLGFAEFSGNRQYLSVGNLSVNEKVSLILMDYPNRRRLKIWGRVELVEESQAPKLMAQLEVATYRARIERACIIRVEAFDWNCPQHISPRYSEAEVEALLEPLQAQLRSLQEQSSAGSFVSSGASVSALGSGSLELVVSGVRQLTPRVRGFELRAADGGELPAIEAGSHLAVPVESGSGQVDRRHYSISSNPRRRDAWEIAVQLDREDGGAAFVHKHYRLGMRIRCEPPDNFFPLRKEQGPVVLIAGGIGITAIKSMALALEQSGRAFQLHYAGRSAQEMAYRDRLQYQFGKRLRLYASDRKQRIGPARIVAQAPPDTTFYLCGPSSLLSAFRAEFARQEVPADRWRVERFSPDRHVTNSAFEVSLVRSQQCLEVPADQTLLEVLEQAGISAPSNCRVGQCGSCRLNVLEGEPDHRDGWLTAEERASNRVILSCVSRARSKHLVLDL